MLETTLIVNWHWPGLPPLIAGIDPPVNAIGRRPGVAVTVKPQVLLPMVSGFATTTFAGSVSVTATAVAIEVLGFSRTIVRTETCPAMTELGVKLLLIPTDAKASAGTSSAPPSRTARRRGERGPKANRLILPAPAMPRRRGVPFACAGRVCPCAALLPRGSCCFESPGKRWIGSSCENPE